jgi:PAS domain S-box-containing protein
VCGTLGETRANSQHKAAIAAQSRPTYRKSFLTHPLAWEQPAGRLGAVSRMSAALQLLPWVLTALFAALLVGSRRQSRILEQTHAGTNRTLQRISQAVESASDAIGIGDMNSETLYINRAHRALFNYSIDELNANEEPAALFADKQVAQQIHKSIRAGISWHGETEVKTKEGRIIPAFVRADIIRDEAGTPIGIFGVFSDITERRAAECALAEERERSTRAERLESLGMLAGGVAHDFGNLLTIIIGNTGLLRAMQDELPPKVLKRASEIEAAAWRAQELSKNLLTFASGPDPQLQTLVLGSVIEEAARGAVNHSAVQLVLEIAPDLAAVRADPVQIDQVVSNLCVNAVQAMPEGGRLRVTAANSDRWPGITPGSTILASVVIVKITDTGTGIPAEELPRIWEPFFTTKAKGTGLGLAIIYAVIKKHGGTITVESTVGTGTTFTLILPATDAKPGSPRRAPDGMLLIG